MPKGTKHASDFTHAVAVEVRMEAARQGLRQSDIADRAGMPRNTLNSLWHGRRVFDTEQLAAVAGVLGVSVSTLTGRAEAAGRG